MDNLIDIALTDDGDVLINSIENGIGEIESDIGLIKGVDNALQSISFRLKTNISELFMHQEIGNELVSIIGKLNTRETANQGKTFIINAITKSNFIAEEDIEVQAIPINENTIVYTIIVSPDGYQATTIILEVDLYKGIRRVI